MSAPLNHSAESVRLILQQLYIAQLARKAGAK